MSGRPERLLFIDNLRWSAISMVVVIHAAVTYSAFGSWYFVDHVGTGRPATIALATYQSFQHAVAMGLLFGIAGFFAFASLERKGTVAYLKERVFRLGVPLLLYMFVVGPLTIYFIAGNWHARPERGFVAEWWLHVLNGEIFHESGPLWFCLVLMLFSFCYALFRRVAPLDQSLPARPVPGFGVVVAFACLMTAAAFLVGLLAPQGGTVLNVDIHDFPQYPLMFAAGVMARRNDWLLRMPSRAGWWLAGGLAGGGLFWFLLITQGGALSGHLNDYGGGLHWQAAGMDLWRSCTCVCLALGLITLYRERFNRQGPIARFLTRNAFGVYVFHPPILIAATRILQLWPLDVWFKFVLASLIGVSATFLFVGLVARRVPWMRAIV